MKTTDKGYACIGLVNPKNADNVGAIMRAAGCYGANSVFYTGRRYQYAREFATDTKRASHNIPLISVDDLKQVIPIDCTPVAVELCDNAKDLTQYKHPERAFYILGPEDGSVPKEILKWCQEVVYIPTNGCMNLAATANVVLYDRMLKGTVHGKPWGPKQE